MQQFELSNYEKLVIKRKIKRKKTIRAIVIFIVVISILLTGLLGFSIINGFFGLFSSEPNLKSLEAPDYVDVQLINIGIARTGVKLVEVNGIVIHYTGNPGSTAQNNRDYFN